MTGKEKKSTNTIKKPVESAFRQSKIEYKVVLNSIPFSNTKIKTKEVSDSQSNDK